MKVEMSHERLMSETGDDDPSAAIDRSRRSISPPARKKQHCHSPNVVAPLIPKASGQSVPMSSRAERFIPSPIQLNRISDLPASSNVDTVSLRDILGDPLISECWIFNYLVDVDYVM
jgi:tyrosyl-DNA phosphodiesterase-1